MRVLVTGSSGRIGRAIYGALAGSHKVIGVDTRVFSTTQVVGDCGDSGVMKRALEGVDAVIHTAGPHAPHVDVVPDAEFERVNIEATHELYEWAREAGAKRFVYTSTTALYANAVAPQGCTWIDEDTVPQPRSIYHRTKLAAEVMLENMANETCPVRVLRMSRCFPEPADRMALYRLHRGVDARDVGTGHRLALSNHGAVFERYILSGATPFQPWDCEALASDPRSVLEQRAPELLAQMDQRGWPIPSRIDRVYSSGKAQEELGWNPRWGWQEVLRQADSADLEVLPAGASIHERSE